MSRRIQVKKAIVQGQAEAKRLLATMDKPAYMGIRMDLGIDVWEVGTLEHNYEA